MANQQIREVYTRTYSVTRSRKALLPYQTLKLLNVLPVELKCLDSPIQCISELIIALVGGVVLFDRRIQRGHPIYIFIYANVVWLSVDT